MPDRYLRSAILDSERFNTLTLDAQNFYYRLISIVDDFGCYDGRAPVIAAAAYRYGRADALPIIDLQRSDLLCRYTNAGKHFVALMQWGEIKRNYRKFPAPPINNDRPEVKYQGIWGRAVNWRNPARCDAVSIMLGLDGRPVQPQPPEWRRVASDWAPVDAPAGVIVKPDVSSPEVSGPEHSGPDVSSPTPRRNNAKSHRSVSPEAPRPDASINVSTYQAVNEQKKGVDVAVASTALPKSPSPETSSPTGDSGVNGKVRINDKGEWRWADEREGEEQRLRWQGMFADLSIPDQLDHAGAWLVAHPEERAQYERGGECEAFLIRWLLREARKPPQ